MSIVARAAAAQRREDDLYEAVMGVLFGDDMAEPNLFVLSGKVGKAPTAIKGDGAEGHPALLFVLDHPVPLAPGQRKAKTTIEVSARRLNSYAAELEEGEAVRVFGRVLGGGEMLATRLEATQETAGAKVRG